MLLADFRSSDRLIAPLRWGIAPADLADHIPRPSGTAALVNDNSTPLLFPVTAKSRPDRRLRTHRILRPRHPVFEVLQVHLGRYTCDIWRKARHSPAGSWPSAVRSGLAPSIGSNLASPIGGFSYSGALRTARSSSSSEYSISSSLEKSI